MSEAGPDALVADVGTSERMERLAVHAPLDGLGAPVARSTVDVKRPGVESVIGDGDRLATARGSVANTTLLLSAVDSAVTLHVAIDLLKDVELTAHGPVGALPHGIAQHPESRPHALPLRTLAHADAGLPPEALTRLGIPRLLSLDAAGRPVARVGVLPGHELQGVAARELDVAVVGRVALVLAVGVDVEGHGPLVEVGVAAAAAFKGVLPDGLHALHGRGVDGLDRHGGEEGGEERVLHGCVFSVL